jgi:hypothetical protein
MSFLWPFWNMPLPGSSGSFDNMMTGWRFGSPNISFVYKGDPVIEDAIAREVAGPGKQLGRISETVLAIAKADPKFVGLPEVKALAELVAEIDMIKEKTVTALADDTTEAFDRLAARDPARAKTLAAALASRAVGAAKPKPAR